MDLIGPSLFFLVPFFFSFSPYLDIAIRQFRLLWGNIFWFCYWTSPTSHLLQVTLIHLEDRPRPGVSNVIQELQDEAKLRVMMLTGDHESSAKRVANAVGINEVYCNLKPEDKLSHVKDTSRDMGNFLNLRFFHFHFFMSLLTIMCLRINLYMWIFLLFCWHNNCCNSLADSIFIFPMHSLCTELNLKILPHCLDKLFFSPWCSPIYHWNGPLCLFSRKFYVFFFLLDSHT